MSANKLPETVYAQQHVSKSKIPRDRLGVELAVGDTIVYALTHFQVSGNALYVGTITKISPKTQDIYATNIPLVEREKSEEKKINKRFEIMKIDDSFMERLLLKRLTLNVAV